jgi:hypothetical protein
LSSGALVGLMFPRHCVLLCTAAPNSSLCVLLCTSVYRST